MYYNKFIDHQAVWKEVVQSITKAEVTDRHSHKQ
jgi:hypothetical protein